MDLERKPLSKRRKDCLERYKKFWFHYCRTQNLVEAYRLAGYKPNTDAIDYANAKHVLKRFDKHLPFNKVLDSQGIDDRFLAKELKKVIKSNNYDCKIRGLALAARCKGHLAKDSGVNVGVKIVIGSQTPDSTDKTIDVTQGSKAIDQTKPAQITE